jgi:hypothetical protein
MRICHQPEDSVICFVRPCFQPVVLFTLPFDHVLGMPHQNHGGQMKLPKTKNPIHCQKDSKWD